MAFAPGIETYSVGITGLTWNPANTGAGMVLSGGNLTGSFSTANGGGTATMGCGTLKGYWEIIIATAITNYGIGITQLATFVNTQAFYPTGIGVQDNLTSKIFCDYSSFGGTPVYTLAAGGIMSVAFDGTLGLLAFYYNGTSVGANPYSGFTTGNYYPCIANGYGATGAQSLTANFGATSFAAGTSTLRNTLNTAGYTTLMGAPIYP